MTFMAQKNNFLFLKFYVECRDCVRIARGKDVSEISSYVWFLIKFWPTTRSASKIPHYTGRFEVRCMVQAFAVYKFLKQGAIKNRNNVAFLASTQSARFQWVNPDFPLLL